MQVVRDDGRGDVQQGDQVGDAVDVGLERLVVLEVADVVGDERVAAAGDAERVLQPGAHPEHDLGRIEAAASIGDGT